MRGAGVVKRADAAGNVGSVGRLRELGGALAMGASVAGGTLAEVTLPLD